MSALSARLSIRVRERRRALGLSQSVLAELASISPELVSRIERGRCLPSLPTLVGLAIALKTTPNDLLGFEPPPSEEDSRPLVGALAALDASRRSEILRIAEALAKYRATPDPGSATRHDVPPPSDEGGNNG